MAIRFKLASLAICAVLSQVAAATPNFGQIKNPNNTFGSMYIGIDQFGYGRKNFSTWADSTDAGIQRFKPSFIDALALNTKSQPKVWDGDLPENPDWCGTGPKLPWPKLGGKMSFLEMVNGYKGEIAPGVDPSTINPKWLPYVDSSTKGRQDVDLAPRSMKAAYQDNKAIADPRKTAGNPFAIPEIKKIEKRYEQMVEAEQSWDSFGWTKEKEPKKK